MVGCGIRYGGYLTMTSLFTSETSSTGTPPAPARNHRIERAGGVANAFAGRRARRNPKEACL